MTRSSIFIGADVTAAAAGSVSTSTKPFTLTITQIPVSMHDQLPTCICAGELPLLSDSNCLAIACIRLTIISCDAQDMSV